MIVLHTKVPVIGGEVISNSGIKLLIIQLQRAAAATVQQDGLWQLVASCVHTPAWSCTNQLHSSLKFISNVCYAEH